MKHILPSVLLFLFAVLFLTFSLQVPSAKADHSWGNYHWARLSNPFTLKLGDNLTSSWDPYLATTSSDWSTSTELDTTIVPGNTTAKRCRATSGRIEICNSNYGKNGWLGIAQIWTSGDHITQGITKVNDSYFNTSYYNTPAWKNLVMCQEVGHNFGLNHQDEDFNNSNLGSCMDYTNDPSTNQYPNSHDYEQLASIYGHADSFTSIQSSTQSLPLGLTISQAMQETTLENRRDWGQEIRNNGHVALYERNLGNGNKVFTFTVWAE